MTDAFQTLCQYVGAFVIGLFALGFALAGLAMMWGRSTLRRDVLKAQQHEARERAMLDGRVSYVRPMGVRVTPSPIAFHVYGLDEADAAARLCGRTVDA